MNYIDLIIVIVLAFNIFDGFRRGFIAMLFEFFGLISALFLAAKFSPTLTLFLEKYISLPQVFLFVLAFFIIWFGVQIVVFLITRLIYLLIPKIVKQSLVNKISGIAPSLAKGLILIGLALIILTTLPFNKNIKAAVENSTIGRPVRDQFSFWQTKVESLFNQVVPQELTTITSESGQKQITLNFKVENPKSDVVSEAEMFSLVNGERAKMGLKPLKLDMGLTKIARDYATQMFVQGIFAHNDLSGKTPMDRFVEAGIKFNAMGENLALAPSVKIAHEGLINSPEHKENILSPDFGRVGIGVVDGGYYGKMFVQEFAD